MQLHLQCGILGWGASKKAAIEPIEILQNITKLMCKKDKQYSFDHLYREAKLLDPRQLDIYNAITPT